MKFAIGFGNLGIRLVSTTRLYVLGFFPRGGNWNNTEKIGLCGLNDNNGNANNNYGFRSVLVVE